VRGDKEHRRGIIVVIPWTTDLDDADADRTARDSTGNTGDSHRTTTWNPAGQSAA
jgi:hypothetical protein